VFLRPEGDNIIVVWQKPDPKLNILVRGFAIDVFHNKTKREAMRVGHVESSVIVYEVGMYVFLGCEKHYCGNLFYSLNIS